MIAFESRIEGQKDACFIFQCRELNFGRIALDFCKTDGSVDIVDRHAVNFVGVVTIPPGFCQLTKNLPNDNDLRYPIKRSTHSYKACGVL